MIQIKKILNMALLLLASVLLFTNQVNGQPANPKSGKDISVQQWVNENFAKGKLPPFSFRYGGIDSKSFIKGWKYSAEKTVSGDPAVQKSIYSYTDNESGFTVKCYVTTYI